MTDTKMTEAEAKRLAAEYLRWCYHDRHGTKPELYGPGKLAVADILDPPPPEPQTVLTTRERPCEVVPEGHFVATYSKKLGGGMATRLYPDGVEVERHHEFYALIRLVPGDDKE